MAESVVENLGRELEELDREYATDFAGHARATRDVTQLDRLIERAKDVVARVDRVPAAVRGEELGRLRDAATQTLSLLQNERTAVAQAKNAGPGFDEFSKEATNANHVFARYTRHFAGQDRSSRDLSMLGEIVDDLKRIDRRMTEIIERGQRGQRERSADFERDRQVVRDALARYKGEINQIEKAQTGTSPEESASILAGLANGQFAVYEAHFAGEPRVSRRPALLLRVITTLKKVHERMAALRNQGLEAEFNTKNISIVEDRLKMYENELAEIRKIRQATPMANIMGDLGTAANKLFEEYRTHFADKSRAKVDLSRLANICDKIGEVRRQMDEMARAEDNEMNARNLDIVSEQLSLYEREYEAVKRAQAAATPSA
ncbi:MAG: hypothetical protein FWD69_07855 [Polyangiaceae bacterium]|nr:hypothetical protein [Polyangiaceae bacterium]